MKPGDRVIFPIDTLDPRRMERATVEHVSAAGYVRLRWDEDHEVSYLAPDSRLGAVIVTGRDALPRHDWDPEEGLTARPCRRCGAIQTDANDLEPCP